MFREFPHIFGNFSVVCRGGMLSLVGGWSTARCWMKLESFMVEVWLSKNGVADGNKTFSRFDAW